MRPVTGPSPPPTWTSSALTGVPARLRAAVPEPAVGWTLATTSVVFSLADVARNSHRMPLADSGRSMPPTRTRCESPMKRHTLIALLILLLVLPFAALADRTAPPHRKAPSPSRSFRTRKCIPARTRTGPKSEEETANPVFDSYTKWIAENVEKHRGSFFVSHTGDIVDVNNRKGSGPLRVSAMDRLHGKVPYALAVGNHDMKGKSGDSSLFQEFFPKSRFEDFDWYAGTLRPQGTASRAFPPTMPIATSSTRPKGSISSISISNATPRATSSPGRIKSSTNTPTAARLSART